jgi:hypothetical protein
VNRGTVVPQRLFSAHTSFDRRQQVDLQLPIFFEGSDGRLGISLEASAAGQCYALREASYPTQLGEKTTTNIRIAVSVVLIFRRPCSVIDPICSRSQWPGYKEFKRPIQARDETSAHNPINVALFAHQIGRTVDAFLQVCPTSASREAKNDVGILSFLRFLDARSGPCVFGRATRTMADRARGHPARRCCDHWCHQRFRWKLDANHATQSLHYLIPATGLR